MRAAPALRTPASRIAKTVPRLDRGAIPWLDLADALHAAGAAGTGIDALYTPGGHLSHQGNAVAARAIEAWLRPRLARLDD
jgi:lysophospholipase L1-like esterase